MKLHQAIDYHSTTPVRGWDFTRNRWDEKVAMGDFLAFDRFVTNRVVVQETRVFVTSSDGPIPEKYPIIQFGSLRETYQIISLNPDITLNDGYNTTYLVRKATYSVDVLQWDTEVSASGMPTSKSETVLARTFGSMDRASGDRSTEFNTVVYADLTVIIPNRTHVTSDNELRINDVLYDVQEVWESLQNIHCKCLRRSSHV